MQILALWITVYTGEIVLILRMMWAFGLPNIILLPLSVEGLEEKKDRGLVGAVLVLLYFVYTMYTVGVQNSNNVLPYQTIFSRWLP